MAVTVPAEQLLQTLLPVDEYLPAAHATKLIDPEELNFPGGEGREWRG